MLKAYLVHDGSPEENAILIYATNNHEARKLGNNHNGIGSEGYFNVRATRTPDLDKYTKQETAYIEENKAILRHAGWSCDGDEICNSCGLSEMAGEFPVCGECGLCPECGHLAGCSLEQKQAA